MGFHSSMNVSNFAAEKETIKKQTIMAQIKVNGENQLVEFPLNVSELISLNHVEQPEMVSVQVNEEFVDRDEWNTTQLKEGDEVDFLYFMGGGTVNEE